MGQAAAVYAEQLSSQSLGHPLWFPEPTKAGETQIGDVGYIENGQFHRLFNITVAADHQWNAYVGVPEGFAPIDIPEYHRQRKSNYLSPGLLGSQSVKALEVGTHIYGNAPAMGGIGASYRFECSEQRGALLALSHRATRENIARSKNLERYITQNHRTWHAFLTRLEFECDPSEIICISGWVKTSEWAVAAFMNEEKAHDCFIQGQLGPFATVGCDIQITKSQKMGFRHHSGPDSSDTREESTPSMDSIERCNQSVFIEFYKVKYRPLFPSKVYKAAAGPHCLPDPDGDGPNYEAPAVPAVASAGEPGVELESIPSTIQARSPLDPILDYLLEHTNADIVITSHGQVYQDSELTEYHSCWQNNPSELLKRISPRIDVEDGIATLSQAPQLYPEPTKSGGLYLQTSAATDITTDGRASKRRDWGTLDSVPGSALTRTEECRASLDIGQQDLLHVPFTERDSWHLNVGCEPADVLPASWVVVEKRIRNSDQQGTIDYGKDPDDLFNSTSVTSATSTTVTHSAPSGSARPFPGIMMAHGMSYPALLLLCRLAEDSSLKKTSPSRDLSTTQLGGQCSLYDVEYSLSYPRPRMFSSDHRHHIPPSYPFTILSDARWNLNATAYRSGYHGRLSGLDHQKHQAASQGSYRPSDKLPIGSPLTDMCKAALPCHLLGRNSEYKETEVMIYADDSGNHSQNHNRSYTRQAIERHASNARSGAALTFYFAGHKIPMILRRDEIDGFEEDGAPSCVTDILDSALSTQHLNLCSDSRNPQPRADASQVNRSPLTVVIGVGRKKFLSIETESGNRNTEYNTIARLHTAYDHRSYHGMPVQTIVTARKCWKTIKEKGEVVWPPYLEAALVEGLEKYRPVETRLERALGRFPMRNKFISDYIFQMTGKRRTPKQVGSRLQQLRDMREGQRILKLLSRHEEAWKIIAEALPHIHPPDIAYGDLRVQNLSLDDDLYVRLAPSCPGGHLYWPAPESRRGKESGPSFVSDANTFPFACSEDCFDQTLKHPPPHLTQDPPPSLDLYDTIIEVQDGYGPERSTQDTCEYTENPIQELVQCSREHVGSRPPVDDPVQHFHALHYSAAYSSGAYW